MKKINNYKELVAERLRVQQELALNKAGIEEEVREIKEKLKPVTGLLSFFNSDKKPSLKSTAMQVGANIGIDVLLRNTVLGRAGWLTRLIVPFIAKKLSAKVIEKTVD
ncbi:MAG: hypothetical protein JNK18_16965 [Cyclobacteriaceae bacterium]|nr:hypothetical protein [Cyclobacteriaceae bacterium]